MRLKTLLCGLALAGAAGMAQGAEPRAGASFLKLGVGAREIGMGTAVSALTNDVNAIYWNPAGLKQMSSPQVGFTHAEWLLDTRYDFVGYAHPTKLGTIAFSGLHFSKGNQEGRDENRQKTTDFTAADTAVSLAFANSITSKIHFGVNIKAIDSRIGNESARTFGLDLGSQLNLSRNTMGGISIRNLGPAMRFMTQSDPLPLTFSLGLGQRFINSLFITGEWQFEAHEKKHNFVMGTEYRLVDSLSLRAGYSGLSRQESQFSDNVNGNYVEGLVGGLGLRLNRYDLDYAFAPFGLLGEAHRFSIGTKF